MNDSDLKKFAIILAGGSGLRLWPESTPAVPKQFLRLFGTESLLQDTVKRVVPVFGKNILFVVNSAHEYLVRRHLAELKYPHEFEILSEPFSRNTAPAVAFAVQMILKRVGDALFFVFPADHLIHDVESFQDALRVAEKFAGRGFIVTFGIKPTRPETGYGYVKGKAEIGTGAYKVETFTEKPDTETASEFVKEGNYFWNSGMFTFLGSTIMGEFRRYAPVVYNNFEESSLRDVYEKMPNISLDYAIMEKTSRAVVIPCDFGWSDLGSWDSVYEISEKDTEDNAILEGEAILENCKGCLVKTERKAIVSGMRNVVVVDSGGGLLVSDIHRSGEIKDILSRTEGSLASLGNEEVVRPWGYFSVIAEGEEYKIKKIVVFPGERLSLQKHALRSETFTEVRGKALVSIGEKEMVVDRGAGVSVPCGVTHRISNPYDQELEIIEVQSGCELEEDDITRIEDDYGRV